MRFPLQLLARAVVTCAMLAGPARADSRIIVTARACASDALDVERRLERALAGPSAPGLAVAVTFEHANDAVRVTVTTREHSVARGETVLLVPTCEEAADAAVVVVALAFSADASRDDRTDPTEMPASTRSVIEPPPTPTSDELVLGAAAPSPERDESLAHDGGLGVRGSSRLSLAGGVDRGTLATTTAFLAAGFTRSLSAIDLRGSLRYGLPAEDERVEDRLRESVRREYGAVGLSACFGLDAAVHLLGCAGGELGLVRLAHRLEVEGASILEQDELSTRVSGVLGAVVSRRGGWVRPELELSGAVLAFGRREGSERLAFRAAAGAAVDF